MKHPDDAVAILRCSLSRLSFESIRMSLWVMGSVLLWAIDEMKYVGQALLISGYIVLTIVEVLAYSNNCCELEVRTGTCGMLIINRVGVVSVVWFCLLCSYSEFDRWLTTVLNLATGC